MLSQLNKLMPTISLSSESAATRIFLLSTAELEVHPKRDILQKAGFKSSYKQVTILPETNEIYVGLTLKPISKTFDPFFKVNLFELGAATVQALAKYKTKLLQIEHLPDLNLDKTKSLFDFSLGMLQASWVFDTYVAKEKSARKEFQLSFSNELAELAQGDFVNRLEVYHRALTLARGLVDGTPEDINPKTILEHVQRELDGMPDTSYRILNSKELQELGMEGILAVGRASRHESSLLHAVVKPKGEVKRRVCLVGKGVTYDSGGLDIKTDGHLKTMKSDMAGSATMFGSIKILSQLNLQHTEVHWISAMVENMIDGAAYKADDILTTYSGQTVEVYNTDAEGRLTLADALTYATLQDPDYIVDAATLTGACVAALSPYYTALMGNDQHLVTELQHIFEQEGERTMTVDMPEVLRESVTGKLSDLINTSAPGIRAGHITAGLFLSHFVDQNLFRNPKLIIDNPKCYSWAHLDIAGTAYNEGKNNLGYNGATGQTIRSLVSWVLNLDQI